MRIVSIKQNDFVTNTALIEQSELDDFREVIKCRRLGLFGHASRLQTGLPLSYATAVCCAASDDTPPQRGWRRPRGRRRISYTKSLY